MERSSLHVAASTRRRLARYREVGQSYDDVLNLFMDGVRPEEFKKRLRAGRSAVARVELVSPPPPEASAGSWMEAAFRLYELGRGEV